MKILLTKKLNQSQRKEFIYRDKTYDWDANYIKLIRDYVEAKFSYNLDKRCNLIDDEPLTDIVFDDILKMFYKSGLNIYNQNNIKKAITSLCKENEFSHKKEEKEIKKQKEKEDKEIKKQKEKEEKENKQKELPDKLYKYIQVNYGDILSYNVSNRTIYYKDKPINKYDLSNICVNIKSNIMFKSFSNTNIEAIINEIAKKKSFKEEILIDQSFDDGWNILKDVEPEKWESYLQVDKKNNLIHSAYNYALFLSFHPQFKDKISYNLFDKIESLKMYDKDYDCTVNKPIDDDLVHLIEVQIEKFFGDFNTKYVERALSVVLNNNSFHELKQKLKEAETVGWDGIPRMHEIMIKYFSCIDNKYIREMTEVMLCGSVQRILEEKPDQGTMFDYMGIMFGKQGTGKTKFMTKLYLGDKYTSINPKIDDDQSFTDLSNRAWLILFDEMKSIGKADMPTVKSRITEQGANVRLSYGRRSKYYPRHIAFWGNTNYRGVLRDEGYERRFLVFECNSNKDDKTPEWWEQNYTDYDIQQIWAETLKIYHEKWENKVISISQECEDYNYMLQNNHKIWVEDSRTDIEIEEIFEYEHYNYPFYTNDKFRIWMKTLDEVKTCNTGTHGKNKINIINCKWLLHRIQRKQEWIDGIIYNLGLNWKKIHVENDEILGTDDYYIRENLTIDDIKKEYYSSASEGFDKQKLPF